MSSQTRQKLALTMIVRNEIAQLPAFLAHHQGLADELVIVDTGSTDGTLALAQEAGATVVQHAWGDDYAAARNAGLDFVSADWIVFLDADERISRQDFGALREALPTTGDRVFLQETWNYCLDTNHWEWQPLRGRYALEEAGQSGMFVARRIGVFRRDAQLRFSGRVHESVLPSAEAQGLAVEQLEVPVHHYGYAHSEVDNADRESRYRRLVEMKHADDPHDPGAQLELATVWLEAGEIEPTLELLSKLGAGQAGLRPVVRGLVLHGRLRREMSEWDAARKLLNEAIRQDPNLIFAWLERLRLAAEVEDWETAREVLSAAEQHFGSLQPQLLREALRINIKTRRLAAALVTAEELVRICPHWQEIQDLTDRLRKMTNISGGA